MDSKLILSLDLGLTTGWAVVLRWPTGGTTVSQTGNLRYAEHIHMLESVLMAWDFNHVVIEMPLLIARGQLRDQLENVIAWTMSALGDLPRTEVYASEWKSTKYAKTKLERKKTRHEKDAACIGLWFTETRLQG